MDEAAECSSVAIWVILFFVAEGGFSLSLDEKHN